MRNTVNIIALDIKDVFDNYALQQVAKFYTLQGWTVINDISKIGKAEKTYISLIFSETRPKAEKYEGLSGVMIGGTGWDIYSRLPAEIEAMRPKLNYGFTTRGCNRTQHTCPFCIVPLKEGRLHVTGDIYSIWNGVKGSDIKIMDNNILQAPDHFRLICEQAKQHRLRLDFCQGLDWRQITEETVEALQGVRLTPRLRIAFDNHDEEEEFVNKLPLVFRIRKQVQVYSIVGFNTTLEEDLQKLGMLWINGLKPYVMRHENVKGKREYSLLATYVNSSGGYFPKITFEQYKERELNKVEKPVKQTQTQKKWIARGFDVIKNEKGETTGYTLSADSKSKLENDYQIKKYVLTEQDKLDILEYFNNDKQVENLLRVAKKHDDFNPGNLIIGGVSCAEAIRIVREKRETLE